MHSSKLAEDDVTHCSMANAQAQGFMFCFRESWRSMVRGLEGAAQKDTTHLSHAEFFAQIPVPDVHDIPFAYQTYAASLLLGVFGKCKGEDEDRPDKCTVTRRELRAVAGIRGMYSYARLVKD